MTSRTRVVLVRPPVEVLHKFSKPVECLALGYLAAAVREGGHEAVLLDAMLFDWSVEEAATRILDVRPDVVGISIVLNHFPDTAIELCRLLREGGFAGPLVAGGHAVSFFGERILRAVAAVDAVVMGEGEACLRAIADALSEGACWRDAPNLCVRDESGAPRRTKVKRVADLDALAPPVRDLTPALIDLDGLNAISTSRGCHARCSFCSVPRFYGLERDRPLATAGWLARGVAGVVREWVSLHERFGIRELLVVDDEFFGGVGEGKARARALARELEQCALPVKFALSCRAENVDEEILTALKRAGLAHVFVGLEAGTPEDLKVYGKGHSVDQNSRAVSVIKGLGLSFQPGYMLFNFRSTLQQIRQNLLYLKQIGECKPVTINSAADPHFGTPLTRAMASDGVLADQGLSMSAGFNDPRVALAKRVAERAAHAFIPCMNFIAGVRSSVTYEWRRSVPGRGRATELALDALEARMNAEFSGVVIDAVDALHADPGLAADELLRSVEAALAEKVERLRTIQAVMVAKLESSEGRVKYWTQGDLIREAAQAR